MDAHSVERITKAEPPRGKLPALKMPDPAFLVRRLRGGKSAGFLSRQARRQRVGARQFLVNEIGIAVKEGVFVFAVLVQGEPVRYRDLAAVPKKLRDGIDQFTLAEFSTVSPLYYMPFEVVAVFDEPIELKKPPPGRRFASEIQIEVARKGFPNSVVEGGIHVHALDRDNKTTREDGAHTHLFILPSGETVITEEGGVHFHAMSGTGSNASAEDGAHSHRVRMPDGILETEARGEHVHQLQVFYSGFDGLHQHELKIGDQTILSATPGEFWDKFRERLDAPGVDAPPASQLARVGGKADLTTEDLATGGGLLVPSQEGPSDRTLVGDGLIISPPEQAQLIVDGKKKLIVKTRDFPLANRVLFLISKRKALGIIKLGASEKIDSLDEFHRREKEHLISKELQQQFCRDQKSWCAGPYWAWPIVGVEAFDQPRDTNVPTGPQVLVNDVVLKELSEYVEFDKAAEDDLVRAQQLARAFAARVPEFVKRTLRFVSGPPDTVAFLNGLTSFARGLSDGLSRIDLGKQEGDAKLGTVALGMELLKVLKRLQRALRDAAKPMRDLLDRAVKVLEQFDETTRDFPRGEDTAEVGKVIDFVRTIDPPSLRKLSDGELRELDSRTHQAFTRFFAGNDKTRVPGASREDAVNAELFLLDEFKRRDVKHPKADALTTEATELRQTKDQAPEYAPIHSSGGAQGDVLKLDEVLEHFKSFKLRMPLLYLVGGLANHGETPNDIDLLIKGPMSPELRHVLEFRLGRMFPPEVSRRLQFLDDEFGGPFTRHIELADLVVEMRPQFDLKQMALVKQDDPLLDLPKQRGPRRAIFQYHFRGKSLHGDLRFQVDDFLVGWTLANQRAGAIRQPIDTVSAARRIARAFSLDGDRWTKPLRAPAKLFATPKSRQPLVWLDIDGEVFEEGEVGATRNEKGVMVAVSEPKVEFGLQKPFSHEYFLTGKGPLRGSMFFRQLVGDTGGQREDGRIPAGEAFWTSWVSKELLPSVLKRRAVTTKSMPPDGFSAIPVTLERATPKEFRYWEKKGREAREIRDALVAARFFTASNIKMVDGEYKRVVTKTKVYVPRDPSDDEPAKTLPARKQAIDVLQDYVGDRDLAIVVPSDEDLDLWPSHVAECAKQSEDAVLVVAPPLPLSDGSEDAIVESVADVEDYIVELHESAHALAALAKIGRPFRIEGRRGWLYVSSLPPSAKVGVEWLDLPDEILKQPRTAKFALSWQFWKGQTVVRAAPSRQVWHLIFDNPRGGLTTWILQRDPLSGEKQITALLKPRSQKDLLTFDGDAPPGERIGGDVLNDTKATPSTIRIQDQGTVEFLEDQRAFKKVRFKGKQLKGIYTLVAEEVGSDVWQFSKGSAPGRAIPKVEMEDVDKAHETKTITLADGTKLVDVQVWDPKKIKPTDDKGGDRARLRPLALFQPLKPSRSFRDIDELVERFATEEVLKGGVWVEPKYNGFRVVLQKDSRGRTFLMSEEVFTAKEGPRNLLDNLPNLRKEAEKLRGPYILDAEFVALDEKGQPVPRRELAQFRGDKEVDDTGVRLQVFDALFLPGEGNMTQKTQGERRKAVASFVPASLKLIDVGPVRAAKMESVLRDAVRWAGQQPWSEGAMVKMADATYTLGGKTSSWVKLKLARIVNAIVHGRDPVKGSPGVWNYFGAVGPIPRSDAGRWKETVEVGGKLYVPIGVTGNSKVDAKVGDVIIAEVLEILFTETEPLRLRWFGPASVVALSDRKSPSSVKEVLDLLQPGERKKLSSPEDDLLLGERVVKVVKPKDAEERYVLGIVLEPETVDAQKDIYSHAEVRQTAHKFMEKFQNIGLMHRTVINSRVKILESFLAPSDFKVGDQLVKQGTWLLAVRIKDDDLWKKVKTEGLTGFSIGGSAVRVPD